jgi:hypothetical protein
MVCVHAFGIGFNVFAHVLVRPSSWQKFGLVAGLRGAHRNNGIGDRSCSPNRIATKAAKVTISNWYTTHLNNLDRRNGIMISKTLV